MRTSDARFQTLLIAVVAVLALSGIAYRLHEIRSVYGLYQSSSGGLLREIVIDTGGRATVSWGYWDGFTRRSLEATWTKQGSELFLNTEAESVRLSLVRKLGRVVELQQTDPSGPDRVRFERVLKWR